MYTIAQLKKMATERIHRIWVKSGREMFFNPYEEREFMIAVLAINENVVEEEKITVTINVQWDNENDVLGYVMTTTDKSVNRIFEAIRNFKNKSLFIPQRTEEKGRKSQFSHYDVWDMIYSYDAGMKLSDIAKYFETTSQNVLNIVMGKSYQWASGISELSFE